MEYASFAGNLLGLIVLAVLTADSIKKCVIFLIGKKASGRIVSYIVPDGKIEILLNASVKETVKYNCDGIFKTALVNPLNYIRPRNSVREFWFYKSHTVTHEQLFFSLVWLVFVSSFVALFLPIFLREYREYWGSLLLGHFGAAVIFALFGYGYRHFYFIKKYPFKRLMPLLLRAKKTRKFRSGRFKPKKVCFYRDMAAIRGRDISAEEARAYMADIELWFLAALMPVVVFIIFDIWL